MKGNLSSLKPAELNFSQAVNKSALQNASYQEGLRMSMEEGFRAGAGHVHTVVSAILLLYLVQFVVYLVAVKTSFFQEGKGAEFYTRVSRGFRTGRFLMTLVLFQKTLFTFVMKTGGGAA